MENSLEKQIKSCWNHYSWQMSWQIQQVDSCHCWLCGALNELLIMQQFLKSVCLSHLWETGFLCISRVFMSNIKWWFCHYLLTFINRIHSLYIDTPAKIMEQFLFSFKLDLVRTYQPSNPILWKSITILQVGWFRMNLYG